MFFFQKLNKLQIFFHKQFFIFCAREKQTCQPLMTQTGKVMEKIVLNWGQTKLKCSETVTNAAKAKYNI